MIVNKTRKQLEAAFLKVSLGAARKKLYALRAEQDGHKQLAKLFYAIAISEDVQARRFLIQLRGQTGNNEQNCETAFQEEIPQMIALYEQTLETATAEKERAMQFAFLQSIKVERIYISLKKKLEQNSSKENSYHICSFCGFIMEEKAPEKCPVCSAPTSRFQEV